jgi:hypothetical protein
MLKHFNAYSLLGLDMLISEHSVHNIQLIEVGEYTEIIVTNWKNFLTEFQTGEEMILKLRATTSRPMPRSARL